MVVINSHRARVTRTENPSGVATSKRTSASDMSQAFYDRPACHRKPNEIQVQEYEGVFSVCPAYG